VASRSISQRSLPLADPARQKTDLIEIEGFPGDLSEMQVTEMHGIEGAAKQADFAGWGHRWLLGALPARSNVTSFFAL
jgi:hypothetical protein